MCYCCCSVDIASEVNNMYPRIRHELRSLQHTEHLSDEALITNHGASSLPGTRHQLPAARSVQWCIDTTRSAENTDSCLFKRRNWSMTRPSGVGVCQRAADTMVLPRPLGVVENALATRTRVRALCWYHRPREQDSSCIISITAHRDSNSSSSTV